MVRAVVALLLLPLAAGATDWLPGTQPEGVACVLVRDARTGAPLAGVRVAQYLEDAGDRFIEAELLAETTTDRNGLATVRWDGEPCECHWVFDLPGFAVAEEYGEFPPDVVELEPGRTLTARVFGPFGKPRGGVMVEAILGCSHSPAVRRAVTDKDGRFTMRDLAPRLARLWFVAPDLAAGYRDADDGDIHALPGITLAGRVSVPHAVVGSQQEMRGPRVVAGPDGSFRIPGFDRGEGIFAMGPEGLQAYVDSDELDVDGPVRLTLRERATGEVDGRPDPDAEEVEVRIEVVADAKPVAAPDAWLVRADGWTFELIEGSVKAPVGKYELRVGDDFSSHWAPPRPFEVKAGGGGHRIAAQPHWPLVLEGEVPEDARVTVVTERAWRDDAEWLAAAVRAAVRVEWEGTVRVFPIGPVRGGARRARIEWPKLRRIPVKGDHSFAVRGAWSERVDDELFTYAEGPLTLVVSDEDLGVQEVAAGAPLRAPSEVEVLLPDGARYESRIRIRDGALEHETYGRRSWCARAGAHVRAEEDGLVPLHRELAGDAPFTVRWGRAGIEVSVAPPRAFTLYVDGALFKARDGRLRLGGLDAGVHTLIVAAPGCAARTRRVVLGADETRSLVVDLGD
jgi:hypothetical protein